MAPRRKEAKKRFQLYWANVLLRSALLAVLGLALLYGATTLEAGVEQKFAEGLAVAILTGAVVSVVMSGKLSRDLSAEILRIVEQESGKVLEVVGLSARLESSGIVEVLPRAPDWDSLLGGAAEITLLPAKPGHPDQEWAAALEVARTRPVCIDIHIPSSSTPNIDALADRFGEDKHAFAAHLGQLPDDLVSQWSGVSPRSGGRLRLFTFQGVPGFAIARADDRCAVLLPTVAGSRAGERPRTVVVSLERDESWSGWLEDQLRSLNTDVLNQRRAQ